MLKRFFACFLVISMIFSNIAVVGSAADTKPELDLLVVSNGENDLYKTLMDNYSGVALYATLEEALAAARQGQGIMVLADLYPTATPVSVSAEQAAMIKELGLRLYVEYAANNDALGITGYGAGSDGLRGMQYNRAVVVNGEALNMENYSLLYAHGARLRLKTDISRAWLVSAKVAGYDTADFGLENTEPYVLLEENADGNVLIASTKLSQFISGRYAPYERWQTLWQSILSWVTQSQVAPMEWTPSMNPHYGPEEQLAEDAYAEAIRLNTQWYLNSGIMPNSDGTEGIYQCFGSGANFDIYGDQKLNTYMRADCNGESAGSLALAGAALNNEDYKNVAYNVMEWLLESPMATGDRSDPESAQYGLLSWNTLDTGLESYYGDDNAKAILGMILAASALQEDKWDQRILEAILANFRTAGVNGFRENKLFGSNLDTYGWEHYYNQETVVYASHYQSLLWGCYLWAYDKTGYEPLLERSRKAISMMMDAYEKTMENEIDDGAGEWHWCNGLQQDRAKMILSLAWLVRIEPTEEHIGWLNTMITDLMAHQDEATGALREAIGEEGQGIAKYGPFTSNDQYGKHEAPVIQANGDPCTDALYTSSFAMMTLNEACSAMEAKGYSQLAETYRNYRDTLSEYMVRIQQISGNNKYNGVWTRGFDYEKWEVYGSDGDAGWGIWCTETGWTQAWISGTLSLMLLDTNIWDYTNTTTVGEHFEETKKLMLTSKEEVLPPTITIDTKLKYSAGAGILLDGNYGSNAWTDGCWNGSEGTDMQIVVDYKERKTFDGVTLGFNRNMNSGVCPPSSVTYYVSDDGVTYTEAGSITITTDVQSEYDNRGTTGEVVRTTAVFDKAVSGQYLKAVVKNPGTYQRPQGTTKTWIFMDELELYTKPVEEDTFLSKTTAEEYDGMPYRLYVPETYDEAKDYPVILFFHGAGERGADNTAQLKHVIQALYDGNEALKDVILIAPQCPAGSQWVDTPWADGAYTLSQVAESASLKKALAILNQVSGAYSVDSDRVYAIGYSMGGFAVWDALARYPDVFAAGIPICGSGATDAADTLKNIPIHTFHGDADTVVPYAGTQETVAAIQAAGGENITFTTYEDCNHAQIVSLVDDEEELIPWLLSQSLADRSAEEVFAPWENESSEAYCEACGKLVSGWIPLVDNNTNILSSGSAAVGRIGDLTNSKHYHVYVSESYTFEGNFATITNSSKVCLHTNGKTLTYQGRLLARGTAAVNIMGNGTITTTGTHTLGEATLVLEDTAALHIYGGKITTTSPYGSPVLLTRGAGATVTIENGAVIDGNRIGRSIKVTGSGDKVIMNGGTVQNGFYSLSKPGIEPNKSFALITGATTRNGGNVFLAKGATFTMNGGTIKDGVAGSDANRTNDMYAGNVFVYGGTFLMNGGTIENGGATSSWTAGNVYITEGGTFTLHDGTIKDGHRLAADNTTKVTTAAGGNVYIYRGTFNLKGGTVSNSNTAAQGANFHLNGGSAANKAVLNISGGTVSGGKASSGGNIYLAGTTNNAVLNMTGGAVSGGTATVAGDNIYAKGALSQVMIAGGTADGIYADTGSVLALSGGSIGTDVQVLNRMYLSGTGSAGSLQLNGTAQLLVDKGWTGSACVAVGQLGYGQTVDGVLWGTCGAAQTSGAWTFSFTNAVAADAPYTGQLIQADAPYLKLFAAPEGQVKTAGAGYVDETGKTVWTIDSEAALKAYDFEKDPYVMLTGETTLTGDIRLKPVDDSLVLSGSGKVWGMDPSNDTYETYYTVTVADGADVTWAAETVDPATGYRYIALLDAGKLSFHRLELELTYVTLRTQKAGIYYKAEMACDETLAGRIDYHGVAVSILGMPDEGFAADPNVGYTKISGAPESVFTSGSIVNIFRTELSAEKNGARGEMKIYAKPYLKLRSGTVLMAQEGSAWSLCDAMEAIEANWADYVAQGKADTVKEFYQTWAPYGMAAWKDRLPNIAG